MSALAPTSLGRRFDHAMPLDAFIASAQVNRELWTSVARRATVPEGLVARAARLPTRGLLVLLEDWCGDAVHTVPPLAALVQATPQLALWALARDANLQKERWHPVALAASTPVGVILADGPRREVTATRRDPR